MRSAGRRGLKPRPHSHDGVRQASHLRGLNLERVFNSVISRDTPFSRTELIADTGLSPPTVSGLAHHLLRLGLLSDLGAGPSRGGRRPSFMEFNARHGYVAGIDLGPVRTRLAVADLRGDVLVERVVETPALREPKALLAYVATQMRSLLRQADVPAGTLLAVGAGAPGAVDQMNGVVLALVPDLKGWSKVPMAAILRQALGAPVVIDNDVNLAVIGEHWRGVARGHTTCAFISVGTGIGAGILVNGELHHGHHFFAGEIALMCMGPQYVEADFGSRGCLETLVGLKAIGARWPHAAELDGHSWVRALFDAARHGDRRAAAAVDEASTLIGMAAANLSVVLDPSLIVLGGELIAQAPAFVDDVRKVVARIVPMPCEIVQSTLAEEATLWGAVLAATTVAQERLRQKLRSERRTR